MIRSMSNNINNMQSKLFKSQNNLIKLLERPFYMILAGTFFSLIFDFVIKSQWYFGEKDLLGAHDTQIPFFASYFVTNAIQNANFMVWNFYDQTDFAYAHLTTGWWTIPAGIIGVFANLLNIFFELNGKQFLSLHIFMLSLVQIFIRVVGLTLLLFHIKLKPIPILLAITIVQELAFYTQALQYLTGFLYSCIYILVFLMLKCFQARNILNLLIFFFLYSLIIFQTPLFGIAYLGMSLQSILISYLLIKVKKIGFLKIIQKTYNEIKKSNFYKLTKYQLCFSIVMLIVILINLVFLIQLKKSFDVNYSLIQNRSTSLISVDWWRGLLYRYGAMDISAILNPTINETAYGWQYLGITFVALLVIGIIYLRSNYYFVLFSISTFLLFCLQVPLQPPLFELGDSLYQFPLWIVATIFGLIKFILLLSFPFTFLFRAPTMETWLLIALLVILAAIVLNFLYLRNYYRKRNIFIVISMSIVYSIFYLEGKTLFIYVWCICILLLVLKIMSHKNLQRFILTAIVLQLMFDFYFLGLSQKKVEFAGPKIIPIEMIHKGITTNNFFPQYNSPFASLGLPTITNSKHFKVLPKSEARLLSALDDRGLFESGHSLTSYFYQTIFLGDYFGEKNYQNKHSLFSQEKGILQTKTESEFPFVQLFDLKNKINSDISILNPLELYEFKPNVYINKTEFRLNPKDLILLNRFKHQYTYAINSPTNLRSDFSIGGNDLQLELNGMQMKSVKGYPDTLGQVDVNNFQKNKIIFVTDKVLSNSDKLILKIFNILPKSNSAKVNYMEIKHSKLFLQIESTDSVRIVTAIPFQKGWKISGIDNVNLRNEGGWLSFEIEPGKFDLSLEYKPYLFSISTLPFILMYLNIIFFIIIVGMIIRFAKK